uniref:DUF4283 domain-containing protein n=1 Tax=Cannabis sativa TaxID=3483 RepID=A0A803PT71_CANSA
MSLWGSGNHSESLVVKILSPKALKPALIEKAMKEAWTLHFPISFSEYHSSLFHASFSCEGDRRRILEEQPWHLDRCLMIFSNLEDFDTLTPNQLRYVPLWLQAHNIPFGQKSPKLAQFFLMKLETSLKFILCLCLKGLQQVVDQFLNLYSIFMGSMADHVSQPNYQGGQSSHLRPQHGFDDTSRALSTLPSSPIVVTSVITHVDKGKGIAQRDKGKGLAHSET